MMARDTLIYDGDCQFCQSQIRRIRAMDRKGRLDFVSLHEPSVRERWPQLEHDQLMEAMHLVDRHGGVHPGADAFRYLSRRLPAMWAMAPILHFPPTMWLARQIYAWIAERRYRWNREACESGSCHLRPGSKPEHEAP